MIVFIALISMTVPVLGFVLTLAYFNQYKKTLASALLCGLAFSAAIYGYIPDDGNDIFRHMANLSLYEGIPLWGAFDLLKSDISHISGIYTWDIWMWIIAQLGNPYLLQSSGAFVGYSITCYMVFDYAKKIDAPFRKWVPILMVFLSFTSPLSLAIGIRSGNAFLICVLALYRFYIEKSSRLSTVSLLLISFFLHHSIIIILLLWITFPLFMKFKLLSIIVISFGLIGFSNYENYLYLLTSGGMSSAEFVSNTLYSASAYQNMDFNSSIHAIVVLIWRLLCAGMLLWLSRKTTLALQEKSLSNKTMWEYNFFYLALFIYIISIVLLPLIGNNSMRFINVVYLLCFLVLMEQDFAFSSNKNRGIHISSILLGIICIGNVLFLSYNMNWGTGSFLSFCISSLLGYNTKIILALP